MRTYQMNDPLSKEIVVIISGNSSKGIDATTVFKRHTNMP